MSSIVFAVARRRIDGVALLSAIALSVACVASVLVGFLVLHALVYLALAVCLTGAGLGAGRGWCGSLASGPGGAEGGSLAAAGLGG